MVSPQPGRSERLVRICLAAVVLLFSAHEETSTAKAMAGYMVGAVLLFTALTGSGALRKPSGRRGIFSHLSFS